MKRLLLLLIMTIILFSNIVTLKAQPLDINAQAYILIDSKTGQFLLNTIRILELILPAPLK